MAKSKNQTKARGLEAAAKGKQMTALHKLVPFAKEINVRLEKASKSEDKAYDHRLAAALKLDEAKRTCHNGRINFKQWCEENVKQSYETVRRLAAVGGAQDPKQALEDMRYKNKKANKQFRDRQAAAKLTNGEALPEGIMTTSGRVIPTQGIREPQGSIVDQIKALFNSSTAADKMDIVIWVCDQTGTTISDGFDAPPAGDNDLLEIPGSLRRDSAIT